MHVFVKIRFPIVKRPFPIDLWRLFVPACVPMFRRCMGVQIYCTCHLDRFVAIASWVENHLPVYSYVHRHVGISLNRMPLNKATQVEFEKIVNKKLNHKTWPKFQTCITSSVHNRINPSKKYVLHDEHENE